MNHPGEKRSWWQWQTTLLLALGSALNYGDRAAAASVLPAIQQDFGLSDVALGMIGATFLWSYAFASPFAGRMADHFPRERIIIWSVVLWSLVMLATGFVSNYSLLLVLRVGLGLTECLYIPAAFALIASIHGPSTRAKAMSTVVIGISVGVIAGGTFSGYIAEHFGWRSAFIVFGIVGLILSLLMKYFMHNNVSSNENVLDKGTTAEAFKYLIRTPSYLIVLLKVMLVGVSLWTFWNWLPYYFKQLFHMDLGQAGFAGTFLLEFSAILGLAAGAWLSDIAVVRHAPKRMLLQALGNCFAAPFMIVFLLHPSLLMVGVSLFAFGFLRAAGDANEASLVSEVIPSRYQATAYSISNTCAMAAGGVGVILAGYFKAMLGLHVIFAASAVLFLAAGIALFVGYYNFMGRDIARAKTVNEIHNG